MSNHLDTLQNSLGKFYFLSHAHCPPSFVQVVGWTANAALGSTKSLHVYIRKVPLKVKNSPKGGSWEYDYDIIWEYTTEIEEPVHKPNGIVYGTAVIIPGGDFLRFDGYTLEKMEFPQVRSQVCEK